MEVYVSNAGHEFKIIHKDADKCLIQFTKTGFVRKALYHNITKGKVRDLYAISVYGVGYYGEFDKNSYWKQAKQLWQNMLKRCYCESDTRGYFGKGVVVSPEWHCFTTFLKDISQLENFDKWLLGQNTNSTKYNLDKDFIVEGCKVYSKETCMFATESENKAAGARNGKPYTKKTRVAKV